MMLSNVIEIITSGSSLPLRRLVFSTMELQTGGQNELEGDLITRQISAGSREAWW